MLQDSDSEEEKPENVGHMAVESDPMTSSWREAEETDTSDEEVMVVTSETCKCFKLLM